MNKAINNLLSTNEFKSRLMELSSKSREFIIISAYITEKALYWLASILSSDCKVTLVARLKASDISNGSSDLKAIEFALENNWQVSRLSELHAKIYLINNENLFVGSANCTSNGLKLYGQGNIETTVELKATNADKSFIQTIINKSDVIDFYILQKMKDYLSNDNSSPSKKNADWPEDIFQMNTDLWISDFLWSDPSDLLANNHDMGLLNIHSDSNEEKITEAFVNTKVFKWLVCSLSESENGELYFGSLTEVLHKKICDDLTPYRRTVKDFLLILLAYCDKYAVHFVKIDRPQYSQRIALLKN